MLFGKIILILVICLGLNGSASSLSNNKVKTLSANLADLKLNKNSNQSENIIKFQEQAEWQIVVSQTYGRYHQYGQFYRVSSNGIIEFEDKEKKIKERNEINSEQVQEISELIEKLKLETAKSIPSDKYNACIVSMHLPNVSFTLKQNGQTKKLTHCNSALGKKQYDHTLILSAEQKEVYTQLREKVISLYKREEKN